MLKLELPFMHNPQVKRLQEMLSLHGYYCNKVDGVFGPLTEASVKSFQDGKGLIPDGIVGSITWAALEDTGDMDLLPSDNGMIYDIRGMHEPPANYRAKKSPRPWWRINGVTIHQTGCNMPSEPSKWRNLNAHIGVTQEGLIVLVNDFQDFIWHAQGLSHNTIGIEIEGNYYGIEGKKKTLWKGGGGPDKINTNMFIALRYLFDYILSEFATNNVEWKYIFAHRQSSNMRTSDPGEQIWKNVARPWAKKLKLDSKWYGGRYYTKGDGLSLPDEWVD